MKPIISITRTILTGVLTFLPVVLTLALIGWIASYIAAYLGPESRFGQGMASIGAFVVDDDLAYLIGWVIVVVALYFLGILVQSRVRTFIKRFFDETIGRIPLVGTIYTTIARFVQLLEKSDDVDVQSMSPVWCFFSDERRTAVLGLLPSNQTVEVEGETYLVVMVPTAPVPFGGGLFFLPADWVRPASFGVEGLTNIYVSMGVTAPDYMTAIKKTPADAPRVVGPDGNVSVADERFHQAPTAKGEGKAKGEGPAKGEGKREAGDLTPERK